MQDGQLFIADMKSTNGSYVDGRRIFQPTPLGPTTKVYVSDWFTTRNRRAETRSIHPDAPI